ncbi:Nucleic acid-binding, OB-fold [Syntrophomonas zehnderi OL-4]|uniref:Single-stranded DNA-binding protein n=1 Tax=Syntrophomonas zehnderi OL-4 TaxID=690567 RepID=A0A0E4C7F9_9FIRM|nr:single-stranded DNA-binding protein [Syntrophomonas zehnderi]CFW99827.1 Nucleic acid-binding, OB-fold [Syntrophomonas zehnderi OL-4]
MYNRVIIIGRLTRDPELRYTPNGTAVASFTLAVNRKYNREETDFIDVVAWRQSAEFCANYGSKGRLTMVEGRLQIRTYETQEGQKRKVTEVVADELKFLDKAGTSSGSGGSSQAAGRKESTEWEDLGREVRLEDIDMIDKPEEDEIPF